MRGLTPHARARAGALVALALGLLACACGAAVTTVGEAGSAPELTAPPVDIQPVGDPAISLVSPAGSTSAPSVAFSVDDAGLLVMAVTVRSAAPARTDVVLTATCFDASRATVATATGGDVFLNPGETRTITLTGPRPGQSIKSATIDIITHPSVPGATPTK